MQIEIRREELLKPLTLVAGVVERRQTSPILSNLLLRSDATNLTMIGTDLEVEIIANLPAPNSKKGEITVPARKLLDICRMLPAQALISFKLEKEKMVIKSGNSRFTLLTMPATDFPSLETARWEWSFALPQQELKTLLEKTHFCMAQQDVRYYLNGLLLELSGEQVRAVATDGHRLALGEARVSTRSDAPHQVIVPRKGVQEIVRFLEPKEDAVEIQLSANHLRMNLGDIVFTSKLIDGRFPDYNKVIPATQSKQALLPSGGFREALTRVGILSNEKYRGARLSLERGKLRITAHNPEQEEASEELPVDYEGEEIEIGFNITYLSEAVAALDQGQVELRLTDPNSSCTLSAPQEKRYLYVVMPMRL